MTNVQLTVHFLLQLAIVLAVCRIAGALGRYIRQTPAVSEMVAGIALGPSVLGLSSPSVQDWLFPRLPPPGAATETHPSMTILYAASQLGLVLFMFCVGLEFDVSSFSGRTKTAVRVSVAGIVAPVLAGGAAGWALHSQGFGFPPGIQPITAAFFVGAAMAVTAFPLLARILHDSGIAGTSTGSLTLAAAAVDDGVAWCLLALVLALVQDNNNAVFLAIGGGCAFVALLFVASRPLCRWFQSWHDRVGHLNSDMMLAALLFAIACSLATDKLGIHAVFGAFVAGAAISGTSFSKDLHNQITRLTSTLLLPLYFVFAGLNTRVGLIDTPTLWMWTAALALVAIVAKGAACTLAARWSGESWRESAKVGALMNARGLIGLVILDIGRQHGLITPTLFAMLVLVALATTLMASPLFLWLQGSKTAPPVSHELD